MLEHIDIFEENVFDECLLLVDQGIEPWVPMEDHCPQGYSRQYGSRKRDNYFVKYVQIISSVDLRTFLYFLRICSFGSALTGCSSIKEGEDAQILPGSWVFADQDQYRDYYETLSEDENEAHRMAAHMDIAQIKLGASPTVKVSEKHEKECIVELAGITGYVTCNSLEKVKQKWMQFMTGVRLCRPCDPVHALFIKFHLGTVKKSRDKNGKKNKKRRT